MFVQSFVLCVNGDKYEQVIWKQHIRTSGMRELVWSGQISEGWRKQPRRCPVASCLFLNIPFCFPTNPPNRTNCRPTPSPPYQLVEHFRQPALCSVRWALFRCALGRFRPRLTDVPTRRERYIFWFHVCLQNYVV